jgi:hypothetical protein
MPLLPTAFRSEQFNAQNFRAALQSRSITMKNGSVCVPIVLSFLVIVGWTRGESPSAATSSASSGQSARWFDGSKTYRLRVPPNPPAENFWSLTIYDTYNRVQLDNPTQIADISSREETLKRNPDGSVDLYVAPNSPAGWENNWIETIPGKAWFAYFRVYGPTEGYFKRKYPLPDFEEVRP